MRFALWTFAITWLVSLSTASVPLLVLVAFAAALAPHGAAYVDIAFLDADLLSPWFLLILYGHIRGSLSLPKAAWASAALGALIGVMGFQQAQLVLCIAMGVVALAAAPSTRARSLVLAACLGGGVVAVIPAWLPLLRNLDQFVSARSVLCIAELSTGLQSLVDALLHPGKGEASSAFATLAGLWLLLFTPARKRFLAFSLFVIGAWAVFGLPHAACGVPLLSGLRFARHLAPHLQMLFIATAGLTIASLSENLRRRMPWVVLAVALATALIVLNTAPEGPAVAWLAGSTLVAITLALLAASPYVFERYASADTRAASHAVFEVGLALPAFLTLMFATSLPWRSADGKVGSPQLPPLPGEIDATTPLGMVQQRSQREDRRHYSPSGFLYPNWSEAFGILDLLSLQALFPLGYHELNAGLFHRWPRDPGHGLVPDRFVPVGEASTMSRDFQRVLAIHRVSLLTFSPGHATFSAPPSPYEATKCQLLGRDSSQGTESYLCPEVGPVGYFPSSVGVVSDRRHAIEQLSRLSAAELLGTVLLGPELDAALGTTPQPARGRVTAVRRAGDDLTYRLQVEGAGVFVIADTYFRGWTAVVNGRPAGISRANLAFKAVNVPVGQVELKLHFSLVLF